MRNSFVLVVALMICSALVSAAEPTTQPQTYPALQKLLAKLKAENDTLKAQVKKLNDENAALKTQVAKLTPPSLTPDQAKAKDALRDHYEKIEVGMSLADALICAPGSKIQTKTESATFYEFAWVVEDTVGSPRMKTVCTFVIDNATQKVMRVSFF